MFEIESKNPDEVTIVVKGRAIKFDFVKGEVNADLEVGTIVGPGEFEIGEAAIRGIATENKQTIYDVVIGKVHIGIIGGNEEAIALDELGVADILCTSSVRAVREIEPKIVIATGNIDGMVTELKLTPKTEKKFKVKSLDALPAAMEVIALT